MYSCIGAWCTVSALLKVKGTFELHLLQLTVIFRTLGEPPLQGTSCDQVGLMPTFLTFVHHKIWFCSQVANSSPTEK